MSAPPGRPSPWLGRAHVTPSIPGPSCNRALLYMMMGCLGVMSVLASTLRVVRALAKGGPPGRATSDVPAEPAPLTRVRYRELVGSGAPTPPELWRHFVLVLCALRPVPAAPACRARPWLWRVAVGYTEVHGLRRGRTRKRETEERRALSKYTEKGKIYTADSTQKKSR